tara:strand:- start:1263 stop:1931 length:669 start_codon:yes stop_codon:yes gene_type:complete
MVFEKLRNVWNMFVNPIASKMGNVSPSALTWVTLPIAGVAAWAMLSADRTSDGGWILLVGLLMVAFASLLDGLDGTVARMHNKVSRYGDFLDHTIDRVVDILFIIAIGYNSNWVEDNWIAWAAALTTLLGSYMGTQSQSVGLKRNYSGFSRADRLVVTCIGLLVATIQAFASLGDYNLMGVSINGMSLIIIISGLGGVWTFLRRFYSASRDLKELDKTEPLC